MSIEYEVVIGLEVHCQLKTNTKIFCNCSTDYDGKAPNSHTCPACTGHPGTLPKLNKKALEYAIKAGYALNCNINKYSRFDKKNYFYPDNPKAFQTSQFEMPYAEHGYIDIKLDDNSVKRINITRIHMEEDAGKLVHSDIADESYVDLNRASMPLIEIVSEPDMRSSEEAYKFLTKLKSLIKYTGVSDVSMELGSLRCDANVSIRPKGRKEFGTRTETKNLNSFKAVARAIEHEIERQKDLIESGGKVIQETRLWDDNKGVTKSMRVKEDADDYRYFPEVDIPMICVTDEELNKIKMEMPEFPEEKISRFVKEYSIPIYDAEVLSTEKDMADYFEIVAKKSNNAKSASNWIMTEVIRVLNEKSIEIDKFTINPNNLGELIKLIDSNVISNNIAKKVFNTMLDDNREPELIVKEQGLIQITDESELEKIIIDIINANPASVADYKNGKTKAIGFLVGQAMKMTKGKGNPQTLNKILIEKLNQI